MYLDTAIRSECRGCTACVEACPIDAIDMRLENGFTFPHIDENRCIHCNICRNTCQKTTDLIHYNSNSEVYYGWNKNSSTRCSSTSGGVFSALVDAFLIQHPDAWIYGVVYDDSLKVVHVGTNDKNKVHAMCRSKYLQSDIHGVYHEVLDHIKKGHYVLFSGTPCQVAGLKALISENEEYLFTVDFICHGVSNPTYFSYYLKSLEHRAKSRVVAYSFRNKKNSGLKKSYRLVRVEYENGKTELVERDLYVISYKLRLFYRDSCYGCHFASPNRCADITMGDFWGIEKEIHELKKQRLQGLSLISFNTDSAFILKKNLGSTLNMYKYEGDFNRYQYLFRPTPRPTATVMEYKNDADFHDYLKSIISPIAQWKYLHPKTVRILGGIKIRVSRILKRNKQLKCENE